MAGFLSRLTDTWRKSRNVNSFLRDLQNLGIENKKEIIRNSQTIGYGEEMALSQIGYNAHHDNDYAYLSIINNETNKHLPFYQKDYRIKKEEYRRIAKEPDLEFILETLADECIVFNDDDNFFCEVSDLKLELKNKKQIQESLERNFQKVYNLFSFNNPLTAWSLFIKFLIDGFLTFEIVYDDDEKNIIGFKEIDPASLELDITLDTKEQVWIQNRGDALKERVIYDTNLIFISYASSRIDQKFSYVERLIKPFNMLHTMEQTRSTWAIMNSSYRMKFIVPVNDQSKQQAKMTLGSLMSHYNEDLKYDWSTGQYLMNGKPHIPGMRQYFMPSRNGETPDIESVGGDGPEMNDVDMLIYFRNKLEKISKIPASRFRTGEGYETVSGTESTITQEESRFNRFVIRLRAIFQEVLIKPIWIQTVLEHPELLNDLEFKNAVSIKFFQYNHFEQLKRMEIEEKILDHIERMSGLLDLDGEPYFVLDFLLKEYGLFSDEKLRENKKLKEKHQEELADNEYSPYGKMDDLMMDSPQLQGGQMDNTLDQNTPAQTKANEDEEELDLDIEI